MVASALLCQPGSIQREGWRAQPARALPGHHPSGGHRWLHRRGPMLQAPVAAELSSTASMLWP